MIEVLRSKRMLSMFLSVALMIVTLGSLSVSAQRRYYGRTHHGRTGGAFIVIGTGVGRGYLIQRHRNRWGHRRYYGRYYSRPYGRYYGRRYGRYNRPYYRRYYRRY